MTQPGPRRRRARTALAASALLLAGTIPAVLLSAVPARGEPTAQAPRWESHVAGLEVSGISSLHIASKGPEVFYASIYGNDATKMGLCESRDRGTTWKPLRQGLDALASNRDPFEITTVPKDEKLLYVVTHGKVFRSANGGANFDNVGTGTATFSFDRSQQKPWIAGVAVDPANEKRLLAGTITRGYYGGLFESKDSGKSWQQIAGTGEGRKDLADSNLGHDAWPLSLDKSDKYVLAGGMERSVLLSEDRGQKFSLFQPGGPGYHRAYAMTPMWAGSGEVFLAESRGLWRTRDRGRTWGKDPLVVGACLGVDVNPSDRRQVFAVIEGEGLYRTDNITTGKWEGPKGGEYDPQDVVYDNRTKLLYLTSVTTGLWKSSDRGDTFQSASKLPKAIPAITHAAVHPKDPRQMLAVTDTGFVFASQDGGATWTRPGNIGHPVTRLVGDPSSSGVWLAAGHGVALSTDIGGKWQPVLRAAELDKEKDKVPDPEDRVTDLVRLADGTWLALWERDLAISVSHDGGKTWDAKPIAFPPAAKAGWGESLAVDPRDSKHMLVATRDPDEVPGPKSKAGGPYETKDGGATWTLLDAGLKSDKGAYRDGWNRGAAAAIDPSGALLYASDSVGVFRAEPAGADGRPSPWVEVAMTGVPPQPAVDVFLAAPTMAGGVEYVMQLQGLTTRALVRSTDGGKTWGAFSRDPGRIESLAVDPTMPGRYVTGDPDGDRGVLVYETPGSTPPPAPTPAPAPAPTPPAPAPTPPPVPEAAKPVPVAGLRAYTGGADKLLKTFDLHEGKVDPVSGAHDAAVLSLVLTKDEQRIYTGAADKLVRIWNGNDLGPIAKLEGHAGAVRALAVSSDGHTLFAGDQDWKIFVWDVPSLQASAKWEGHVGPVNALVLSSDGTRLYSAGDKTVRVWDVTKPKEPLAATIATDLAEVLCLAVSADGKRVYAGGRDSKVRVYDDKGAPVATIATQITGTTAVTAMALSPDGSTLYVAGDGKVVESFSTSDGKPGIVHVGPAAGIASLAVSADGLWVAGGGDDGILHLWRAGRAQETWASGRDHAGAIYGVTLTPDVEKAGAGGEPPASSPAMAEPPPMAEPSAMSEPPMGEPGNAAMGEAPAPPAMSDGAPAPAPAMGDSTAPKSR